MRKKYVWLVFIISITIFSCVHDSLITPSELPSGLIYSPDSLALQVGSALSSVRPTILGTEPLTFNLSTSPSSGGNITVDTNGVIYVSGNLSAGKYAVTVIVINDAGSVAFTGVFKVRAYVPAKPPSQLIYTPSTASVLTGTSYTSTVPSLQGTSPFTFTILSNPAPGKITINNQGIISATQVLASGTYPLNIQVTNAVGSATFDAALTISVSNTPIPPSGLTYSTNTLTINEGSSGSSVTPGLSGTSPFTFSLTSSPSAGSAITINNNGVITATSSLTEATYVISVTVTNSSGTANYSNIYTITVNPFKAVTFANDIKPLITQHCATCHTVGPQTIYTNYTNASTNINWILDRVQRAPGTSGFMPKSGSALTSAEIQLLKDWLAQGLPQ